MNETEQARYDAAGLFSGMTAEEYQESQKAGEETGTEKKQAVLQALMDRGQKVFPESLDGSRGAQGGADCDG